MQYLKQEREDQYRSGYDPRAMSQPSRFARISSTTTTIEQLHQTIGNQAVARLLNSGAIQAKLSISQPNDVYEQEADRIADKVMRMPEQNMPGRIERNMENDNFVQSNMGKNKSSGGNVGTPVEIPNVVKDELRSRGQPLDSNTRDFFDSRFGVNFSQIRVHTGANANRAARSMNAEAFSVGNKIIFEKGKYSPHNDNGRSLLAHELAHVVSPSHTGLMRSVTPDYNDIKDSLTYGPIDWVITDSNAHDVLVILSGLNATDLHDTLVRMESDGFLSRLLDNISSADLVTYNAIVQSVLQRIQRTGATGFAAGLGLTSQVAMAQAQATFMHTQNEAAAKVVHGPSPTAAQISAQQVTSVASTSIAPQTATLSVADETLQNTAAIAARAVFVTWVKANHPDLNIKSADIRVDSRAIFDRGLSIIAFADAGQAVVGPAFTQAVNANPAYALPTIIHELRGHEQYGPYGQAGSEYGLELYDLAAPLMTSGYTQPTGAGRTSEIDAYAYQETEIYSLMIEVPYFTPVTPVHSALSSVNYDPAPEISNRIGTIKTQFEPRVAKSLLRGLLLRFRADPRLSSKAITAFEQGIRNNFTTKSEAEEILK